jgi:hypothetical protein
MKLLGSLIAMHNRIARNIEEEKKLHSILLDRWSIQIANYSVHGIIIIISVTTFSFDGSAIIGLTANFRSSTMC